MRSRNDWTHTREIGQCYYPYDDPWIPKCPACQKRRPGTDEEHTFKKATASGPHLLTDDPQREAARTLEDLLQKEVPLQPPRTKIHQQGKREKQWRPDQKSLNITPRQRPRVMHVEAEGLAEARTKLKESGERTRNKAQDQSHLTTGETSTSAESSDCSERTEKEPYG